MRYHPTNVKKLLLNLQNVNEAIKEVILLSVEGLPIASTLPRDLDQNQLSALSATILALGMKGSMEMNNGEFNHLFIQGSDGGVLIFQLSKFEIFVLFTKKASNVDDILLSLNDFKHEGHSLFNFEITPQI